MSSVPLRRSKRLRVITTSRGVRRRYNGWTDSSLTPQMWQHVGMYFSLADFVQLQRVCHDTGDKLDWCKYKDMLVDNYIADWYSTGLWLMVKLSCRFNDASIAKRLAAHRVPASALVVDWCIKNALETQRNVLPLLSWLEAYPVADASAYYGEDRVWGEWGVAQHALEVGSPIAVEFLKQLTVSAKFGDVYMFFVSEHIFRRTEAAKLQMEMLDWYTHDHFKRVHWLSTHSDRF